MHLFVSFILKAVAVFIKDVVLYDVWETDNCQSPVSRLHSPLCALERHRVTHQQFISEFYKLTRPSDVRAAGRCCPFG